MPVTETVNPGVLSDEEAAPTESRGDLENLKSRYPGNQNSAVAYNRLLTERCHYPGRDCLCLGASTQSLLFVAAENAVDKRRSVKAIETRRARIPH